jgi:hypothetical protein
MRAPLLEDGGSDIEPEQRKSEYHRMASKRVSLWGRGQFDKYWTDTAAQEKATAERRDGVPIAQNIDAVWKGLTDDERLIIEHLLLSGSPTAVALIEGGVVDSLTEKGLLRKPPGVGTLMIYQHQTTYDVPSAVWQALNDRIDDFLPAAEAQRRDRLAETTKRLDGSLIVVNPKNRS